MKALVIAWLGIALPIIHLSADKVAAFPGEMPTGNIYIEGDWLVADSQDPENIVNAIYIYDSDDKLVKTETNCGEPVCSTTMSGLPAGTYTAQAKASVEDFSGTVEWGG